MAQLDDIYTSSIYLIPWITFLVAIGGSAHCAGMCGGLVIAFTKNKNTTIAYQVGRLTGYILIGFVAASLGSYIKSFFQSSTMILLTSLFMGGMLIFWGLKIIFKEKLKLRSYTPKFLSTFRFSKYGFQKINQANIKSEVLRSGSIGFMSIFLPCGFLYGVVFVVAIYENPMLGMISMLTFWIGTLPALVLAPKLFKLILNPIKNKAPILSSLALISLGAITISSRLYQYYTYGSCH